MRLRENLNYAEVQNVPPRELILTGNGEPLFPTSVLISTNGSVGATGATQSGPGGWARGGSGSAGFVQRIASNATNSGPGQAPNSGSGAARVSSLHPDKSKSVHGSNAFYVVRPSASGQSLNHSHSNSSHGFLKAEGMEASAFQGPARSQKSVGEPSRHLSGVQMSTELGVFAPIQESVGSMMCSSPAPDALSKGKSSGGKTLVTGMGMTLPAVPEKRPQTETKSFLACLVGLFKRRAARGNKVECSVVASASAVAQ